jgi:DNA-binding beta-propeller fold protein YncE
VMVYDRTENTPPKAALSEPKRMIGGEQTYLEYGCGVYVDPVTGEIYIINNDTLNWMPVFDRNAKGNATPNRRLATPYSTFGIVGDEDTQEILMTIQEDNAVIAFKKTAKGQDAPVRLLQGPKTNMADPHGIALDTKTGLIYVTNWGINYERRIGETPVQNPLATRQPPKANWPVRNGLDVVGSGKLQLPSITVYRKTDSGDVAPIRTIQGSKTLMNWPTSIAVHPDRNEIFVANDTGDSITVYREDASGDVAPIRVIKGPKSLIKNPTAVALDLKNNELWVANYGNHSATVYPVDAGGDPAPKRIIRSAPLDAGSPNLSNPHTVAFDTKRDELLVSN